MIHQVIVKSKYHWVFQMGDIVMSLLLIFREAWVVLQRYLVKNKSPLKLLVIFFVVHFIIWMCLFSGSHHGLCTSTNKKCRLSILFQYFFPLRFIVAYMQFHLDLFSQAVWAYSFLGFFKRMNSFKIIGGGCWHSTAFGWRLALQPKWGAVEI